MILLFTAGMIGLVGLMMGFYFFAIKQGKNKERNRIIRSEINEAIKTKKRQFDSRNLDLSIIRNKLRKYTRDD